MRNNHLQLPALPPLENLRGVPEANLADEEESPLPKAYKSATVSQPKEFTLKLWKVGQPVKVLPKLPL